jgi:exodeoxyribonuclease-3
VWVLGLQELKLESEQFPHDELAALGWKAAVHGQKAWNGVAVLARTEPVVVQAGLPGQDEAGARLLTVAVGDLTFTTIYVPNGKSVGHPDFTPKLAWLDALFAYLRATHPAARPAFLCGDFNLCPAAIDSWNEEVFQGHIFHTGEERSRFRALLDFGWYDAFRERNPDTQAFSWWDYRGGAFHRKMGLRIDLLLATEPALRRVTSVGIDREWRKKKGELIPSDHAPVVAELD